MENFRRGQEDVPLGLPRGLGGGNTLISLEKQWFPWAAQPASIFFDFGSLRFYLRMIKKNG